MENSSQNCSWLQRRHTWAVLLKVLLSGVASKAKAGGGLKTRQRPCRERRSRAACHRRRLSRRLSTLA